LVDVANVSGAWVYTYNQLNYDYLRQPGGIRQLERTLVDETFVDKISFLITDQGNVTAKIDQDTSSTVHRLELTSLGDRQAGGSSQDMQVSNFGFRGGFIEEFSSQSGDTAYFEPLLMFGDRHYLSGLGRFLEIESANSLRGSTSQGDSNLGLSKIQNVQPMIGVTASNIIEESRRLRKHDLGGLSIAPCPDCKDWLMSKVNQASDQINPVYNICCAIKPSGNVSDIEGRSDIDQEDLACRNCICMVGKTDDISSPHGCFCSKIEDLSMQTGTGKYWADVWNAWRECIDRKSNDNVSHKCCPLPPPYATVIVDPWWCYRWGLNRNGCLHISFGWYVEPYRENWNDSCVQPGGMYMPGYTDCSNADPPCLPDLSGYDPWVQCPKYYP
jgi:hypothetical protein